MLRTGLSMALLLSCLAAPARADDPPAFPPRAKAAHKAALPRKTGGAKARKAASAAARAADDGLTFPASTPGDPGDAGQRSPLAAQDAWSVSPKWSAANGGSSAPYGTRALMNELGTNPAETTGYGAGAEVKVHF